MKRSDKGVERVEILLDKPKGEVPSGDEPPMPGVPMTPEQVAAGWRHKVRVVEEGE